jgi:hypothetical protein
VSRSQSGQHPISLERAVLAQPQSHQISTFGETKHADRESPVRVDCDNLIYYFKNSCIFDSITALPMRGCSHS